MKLKTKIFIWGILLYITGIIFILKGLSLIPIDYNPWLIYPTGAVGLIFTVMGTIIINKVLQ